MFPFFGMPPPPPPNYIVHHCPPSGVFCPPLPPPPPPRQPYPASYRDALMVSALFYAVYVLYGSFMELLSATHQVNKYCRRKTKITKNSAEDPDPDVYGPPGSGSISQRCGSGSGSGSFPFLK